MEELEKIKNTLEISKNEGTRSPYWLILDPEQNMGCSPFSLANQITGPFFCRDDAEKFLSQTRYNFSHRAVVFCLSGCYSKKYDDLCSVLKI